MDSALAPAVPATGPKVARLQAHGGARSLPISRPASREEHPESLPTLPVQGDALTRYRLGLAWQLGRSARIEAAGMSGRPVTVELAVILVEGRAVGVEIMDDGGFATLAARAAEQVRQASRVVPVPPELGESTLQVGLGLRFEP